MAGWLSRATSLFQQPPPPPEPFEVECDCGGKVTGNRTNAYQKPGCPFCERPVFVLPANVYPRPKPKPIKTVKPVKQSGDSKSIRVPSNVVVEDRPGSPSGKSSTNPKSPAGRAAQKTPAVVETAADLSEPKTPLITTLRLVTVGIIVMSALTLWGLWRRHNFETAKAIVLKSADAGKAAMAEQDFANAALEFDRARKAVDILGRTDQVAMDIRRQSREATALANLATSSLTECVQETLSNSTPETNTTPSEKKKSTASSRPDQSETLRMSSAFKGAWVIFDANVYPASEGKDRFVVDAPILLKEGNVRIEIESPLFRSKRDTKDSINAEVDRVIFAAQLEQLSTLKGQPLTAVLTLNGKTAFLWTSYDTFAAIGYRPFDAENEQQTRAVLERQAESSKDR